MRNPLLKVNPDFLTFQFHFMKNPSFFTPIILFLFSFLFHGNLFAYDTDDHRLLLSNTSTTEAGFEDPTSCGVPTWPSTSNITQTSATFSWSPVSGAESYSVQTRVLNGTWYTVPGSPFNNTTVTVNWFLPNTTYQWRVSANCWGGEYSYWTAPITFTTSGSYNCEPPSWLETNYITENSATFDWSAASGAISYSIQWRVSGGSWQDLGGGPWQNTWLYIGGLQPNTTYNWRVRSNCGGGMSSSWSYTETFTTLGYSCGTPTWPSTSNITNTSATFSWSSVGGAQSYTVQTRLLNGTWYDVSGGPFNSTWVTVNGLSPNTTYQWRVRANCGGGQYSAWTSAITFTTTGGGECHAPYWLNTTEITQTSAKLSWSSVSGAHFYTIQYRIVGSNSWINLGGGPWNGTWHTITGLQPGTTYEWRVRSTCDNYELSPWSNSVSFTTLGGYSCDTPTWPSTSNITSSSATFSWSSVWGVLNYTVQIRQINGNWYDVPGSPTNSSWITVNNLNPNTTYQWRVRSNCNNWQYSYWTNPITFTTTGGECHAPYWLNTSNINQTSATLSWSAVNGAHFYSLQYRVAGGTWYNVNGGPWNGTWHTITGLQPGTAYEWRVRSTCDNYVLSPWSYPAYFTTLGYSCSMPTWPSTSNITQTSANFSWSSVWGAYNYTVQIRLLNGQWYDLPNSPTSNNWIAANNLTPGTTYQWRVRTTCNNWQYSYWTDPITFTTLGSYCQAPYSLNTSNITHNAATLNWSAVSGAHYYTLQYRLAGGSWYDVFGGPWYGTWHTLSGLQPGTAYEWRVRSTCANYVLSPWSYPASFITSGYTCYTPTWPSTSEITQTSARLSWSAVSSALSYSVEIRTPTGSWVAVLGSPVSSPWINATGLNPGTTYQWRVRANCVDGGYSSWTYPVSFTTIGVVICYAPSGLWTNSITETSANLDWTSVSGAYSYDLQYRLAGSVIWTDVPGGPFTETWHVITGLSPGTHYEWRVRSNCHTGYSEWSNIAYFSTLGVSCLAPESTATTDITETSATFTWLSVPGAQTYSVQTRVPNGTWSNAPGSPYSDTTVILGGLIPGTTYHWRVRANCGTGDYSAWTSPLSFTTSGGAELGQNECDSAKILNVNNTCINTSSSNVGATESSPPPMGWCPDNNYKDVWFRFTMPDVTDPVVTIRTTAGTLTDAVMEVYRGGGCADLEYIFCEDDNSQGNGSTMPVITITGTANETIWVRVWGYAGTKGTFSICVLDYQSTNLAAPDDSDEPIIEGESFDVVEIQQQPFNDRIINTTLQVFPNPTRDVIQVLYTQTKESTISRMVMMDMSGKIVDNKEYQSTDSLQFSEQLDVSSMVPGVYILRVFTTSGILTEKVSVID